jgi:hypothetical protein
MGEKAWRSLLLPNAAASTPLSIGFNAWTTAWVVFI